MAEKHDIFRILKLFDHFEMTPDDLDIVNEEIKKESLDKMANTQNGYVYGRVDKVTKLDLVPYEPVAMRHFLLCKDPNIHILDRDCPIHKVLGKIRVSNMLGGHSFAASLKHTENEETTARSQSSASKIAEIKNTYRKQQQNTEDTTQGEFTSTLGSGYLHSADFKKSLLSNPSNSKRFSSDIALHRNHTEPRHETVGEKPKKHKSGVKFNSEYKPHILSTEVCKLLSSDWKPHSKESAKKEKEILDTHLATFMKPRGIVKIENRKGTRKLLSANQMDCNEFFSQVITEGLAKKDEEMQTYDE